MDSLRLIASSIFDAMLPFQKYKYDDSAVFCMAFEIAYQWLSGKQNLICKP